MVLLGSKDPAPFSIFNSDGSSNLLFTSDHNGSAIPIKLQNLGVPLNELRRHVAYDIGINAVAHALSARFNATLIVANYSRLVIDCNRHPGAAGSIPSISITQLFQEIKICLTMTLLRGRTKFLMLTILQ